MVASPMQNITDQLGLTNYGQQQMAAWMNESTAAADPFASQRGFYQKMLMDLMMNPSSITSMPGYQFGLNQGTQALERSMAGEGYSGSGNMAVGLTKYAQGYAGDYLAKLTDQLMTLAGGRSQGPAYNAYGMAPDVAALGQAQGAHAQENAGYWWPGNAPGTMGASFNSKLDMMMGGGMGGGMGAGGKVICTQLFKDGFISRDVYSADLRYAREHFSESTINGYRYWAVPYVKLMRRNKVAYAIGKFFGTRYSQYCASHYLKGIKPNKIGKWFKIAVVPICALIGVFADKVDYMHLWRSHA